jgi:peptidoglycan glycosyltransferase
VVQAVELVKLLLVFFVAAAAYPAAFGGLVQAQDRQRRVVRMRPWMERYQGMLGAFALVLATLALMKDFGPMLLLAFVLLCWLIAQGHYRQSAFGVAVLLALLGMSYLIGVPSRWHERVDIWRDPWHETAGDSKQLREGREHMTRVTWAVSAGGLAGAGLGQGMPTDIAEVQSDFVFAAIAEELGWVGGAAALALLLALVASGLSLAAQREDAFEKALLSGVAMLLGVQSALTIGGNLGLWPLTGITLPFVSYGGSSLLVNFLALGICVGVAGRSAELRASSLPLPADLSQRMNRSLGKLQIAFAVLFALLAAKAAWLQWPANATQISARPHLYADGSGLGNPRLDSPTWVARGQFLDREGQPIANPQQYVHLIGFETRDRQRVGLRNYLNDVLSGRLKGAGGLFPWSRREERGYDVVLTLDQRLQAKAYQLLRAELASRGGRGSIVGIVPQTGEVVIAANWPPLRAGATPNEWLASYDSKPGAAPFCYRKVYAPGSTFKTLVAAAALDTGAVSPSDTIHCDGSYTIYKDVRPIRDWQLGRDPGWHGHGDRTLREALPPSCNSIFAKVGVKLGWKRLLRFAGDAWFGAPLPLLPEDWRRGRREWFESANSAVVANREVAEQLSRQEQDPVWLAQTALGQRDVRMTPLHMALWAATIANGGEMMSPTVVRAVQTNQGKRVWEFAPRRLSRVMSEETAAQLAVMMEEVVESGTGHPAWTPGLRIAGKTGTPETGLGGKDAVFIAFGPVEDPKLALAVVLEDTAGGGGSSAGPIVRALMRAAVRGDG